VGLAVTWASRRLGETPAAVSVTGTVEATQVGISPRMTGRIDETDARKGSATRFR